MKTKEEKDKGKQVAKQSEKRIQRKSEELKTDLPISEKDEVKKAERRLQNNSK